MPENHPPNIYNERHAAQERHRAAQNGAAGGVQPQALGPFFATTGNNPDTQITDGAAAGTHSTSAAPQQ